MRDSLNRQRAIYDDDLRVRLDAAIARTRRFLHSSQFVRAGDPEQAPFMPRCSGCRQSGRSHRARPTHPQHYICAHCPRRWVVDRMSS